MEARANARSRSPDSTACQCSRSLYETSMRQGAAEGQREHPGGQGQSTRCRCPRRQHVVLTALRLLPILLLWRLQPCSAATPLSDWNDGIATNYGGPFDGKDPGDPSWGTSEGSCGYGMLDKGQWPYWSVAALSTSNSFALADPIKGCGQCFEIKCIDKDDGWKGRCITGEEQVSIVVQITDSCPECGSDHIDIQAGTFDKLAPMYKGRIHIQYRRVECVPPANLAVYVDQNFGQDKWLRLFVVQAGGKASVKGISVKTHGSSNWIAMDNKWGGAFEYSHAPPFPLDVMIYGDDGPVTAYNALTDGGVGQHTTGVQFFISNPSDSSLVMKLGGGAHSYMQTSVSVDTNSGSNNGGSNDSGSSNGGDCVDHMPSGQSWSCADKMEWGQCDQEFLVKGDANSGSMGFCAKTCGRCSDNNNDSSTGGRRHLLRGPA